MGDKLPEEFRPAVKVFAQWGWKTGNPDATYEIVDCPDAFIAAIEGCFDESGVHSCPAFKPASKNTTPAPQTTTQRTTAPSSTSQTTTHSAPATPAPTPSDCSAVYGQCGGKNWTGATCCQNSKCKKSNDYYSQCLPEDNTNRMLRASEKLN